MFKRLLPSRIDPSYLMVGGLIGFTFSQQFKLKNRVESLEHELKITKREQTIAKSDVTIEMQNRHIKLLENQTRQSKDSFEDYLRMDQEVLNNERKILACAVNLDNLMNEVSELSAQVYPEKKQFDEKWKHKIGLNEKMSLQLKKSGNTIESNVFKFADHEWKLKFFSDENNVPIASVEMVKNSSPELDNELYSLSLSVTVEPESDKSEQVNFKVFNRDNDINAMELLSMDDLMKHEAINVDVAVNYARWYASSNLKDSARDNLKHMNDIMILLSKRGRILQKALDDSRRNVGNKSTKIWWTDDNDKVYTGN